VRRILIAVLFVVAVTSAASADARSHSDRTSSTSLHAALEHGGSVSGAGSPAVLSMLVMGDSYSAGNGGGSYFGAAGCYRSAHNYARQYERKIEVAPYNQRGFVENTACSGATTDAFFETTNGRPPELNAVNHSYDVIFLTIGGNDIHFGDIVRFCLVALTRDGANCGPNLTRAEHLLDDGTLYRRISKVLHAIQTRAAATAKIVLLGYPHLEGDPNYRLRSGHFGNTFIEVGKRIRTIGDRGELIQERVVKDLNAKTHGQPFIFVSVQQLFDGPPTHVLFAQRVNPNRWMVQPGIDASRATFSTYYHPNPTGWDQEAKLLLNDPRVPKHPQVAAPPPPPPGGGSTATRISPGFSFTCATTAPGGVSCWGNVSAVGLSTSTRAGTPIPVAGFNGRAVAVSSGAEHACALMAGGGVQCWGWSYRGQLGNGSLNASSTPVTPTGLTTGVRQLSVNDSHSCVLSSAGGVECWGEAWEPLGGPSHVGSSTPTLIPGLSRGIAAISVGPDHACAVTTTRQVQCWGQNALGQLGDGTKTASQTPVAVHGLPDDVVAVSAGAQHSCALTSLGSVHCWGNDAYGQLGNNSYAEQLVAVAVKGLPQGVVSISAGGFHTCALTSAGRAYCWGDNGDGELGDGSFTSSPVPVEVKGLPPAAEVVASANHTCAVTKTDRPYCWGLNQYGELGDGDEFSAPVSTPQPIVGFG
jgi:alpha-tubulin suppressor-like RCC1 family protein/lysophospholipase L1-like esterase